jgi:hypothetical protein
MQFARERCGYVVDSDAFDILSFRRGMEQWSHCGQLSFACRSLRGRMADSGRSSYNLSSSNVNVLAIDGKNMAVCNNYGRGGKVLENRRERAYLVARARCVTYYRCPEMARNPLRLDETIPSIVCTSLNAVAMSKRACTRMCNGRTYPRHVLHQGSLHAGPASRLNDFDQ